MKEQAEVGNSAFFSGLGIWGAAAKSYKSIDEIKADEARLERLTDEEYSQIKTDFGNRLSEIAESIMNKRESNYFIALDNAMECIIEAVRDSKTRSGLLKNLKSYTHLNVTETTVSDIVDLVRDISNMPTTYFEAKPQRAVGFDEIAAVIMPKGDSAELIEVRAELEKLGIPVKEYTAGDDAERTEALNSIEDIAGPVKFQAKKDTVINTDYSDLSKLDADSLKVYNDRGWARELFSSEDWVLYNEHIGYKVPKNSRYVKKALVDGTLVIDFNNKLVLVSGEYGEDKIYGVVTVNSKYADDIDYYKEDIYAYTEAVRPDKNGFGEICRIVTDVQGEEFIRYYEGNDYSYQKGHSGKGNRATLPNNWENSEYTAVERDGENIPSEAQSGVSEAIPKVTKFQHKSLDALSDSELLARHLEENSEAVGEILSRTADIEINPRVLNLLVNRKLKEYGISKEGRESVADVVPLLLDSAKIAAVKGGDKQKHRRLRLNHPSFMKRQNQQRLLQNHLLLLTILSLPTNSSLLKKICKGLHPS